MTSVLRPNPAAFDGHWYTPAQMARLAGVSAAHLGWLDRQGKLPKGSVKWAGSPGARGSKRRYDAGKVLASQRKGWRS